MGQNERNFEIRVQGHTLVRVSDSDIRIDGKDFHSDLRSLSQLVDILSNIIATAHDAGKPRLIAEEGESCPQVTLSSKKHLPCKIANI